MADKNIQIAELDFDSIKNNLKTFLKGQDTFKDYNFEGAGLSNLLDVLAYNTHYNAYYLNMVANEMFLDTAQLRSSAISIAKLLNYTPRSAIAPTATINLVFDDVDANTHPSITLPKNTKFQSNSIDGVNYTFVTTDDYTENTLGGTVSFLGLPIKQGEPLTFTYTYNSLTNESQIFEIPDALVDTSSILVTVQESSSNTYTQRYDLVSDYFTLSGESMVYFLQESLNGFYEIYFGDGILGKPLKDGNLVHIEYLVTSGVDSSGANNFTLMDDIGPDNVTLSPLTPASEGFGKESLSDIKFTAPKYFSAQNRAVSAEDYISLVNGNKLGFEFDSVNAWSGEDEEPPAYGQVFISVKPKGAYNLSRTQKDRFLTQVIRPNSVLTVVPNMINPDYTYITINADVLYNQKKTTKTAAQMQEIVKAAIQGFGVNTLNKFSSIFSMADLVIAIKDSNPAIITSEISLKVQKKIYPIIGASGEYVMTYGMALKRSSFQAGITMSPTYSDFETSGSATLIEDIYIEEVPFATSSIDSIKIINPGFGYTDIPIVTIEGDGTGATAHAEVKSGFIFNIVLDTPGANYSQAVVRITPANGDSSGRLGAAVAELQGRYGTLRSYHFIDGVKTPLRNDVGTIDYQLGIVTLVNFNPSSIDNDLGQVTMTAMAADPFLSSSKNRILTIDPFDPNSILVKVISK